MTNCVGCTNWYVVCVLVKKRRLGIPTCIPISVIQSHPGPPETTWLIISESLTQNDKTLAGLNLQGFHLCTPPRTRTWNQLIKSQLVIIVFYPIHASFDIATKPYWVGVPPHHAAGQSIQFLPQVFYPMSDKLGQMYHKWYILLDRLLYGLDVFLGLKGVGNQQGLFWWFTTLWSSLSFLCSHRRQRGLSSILLYSPDEPQMPSRALPVVYSPTRRNLVGSQ